MLAYAEAGYSDRSLRDFVPRAHEGQRVSGTSNLGFALVLALSISAHAGVLLMKVDVSAGVRESTVTSIAMRFASSVQPASRSKAEPKTEPEPASARSPVLPQIEPSEPVAFHRSRRMMSDVGEISEPVPDFQESAVTDEAQMSDGDIASLPMPGPAPAAPTRDSQAIAEQAPALESIEKEPPPASKEIPMGKASLETASREPASEPLPLATAEESSASSPAQARAGAETSNDDEPIVITDPEFRTSPTPPEYPKRSVHRREEGVVLVRALLTETGAIETVKVWQSSGFVRLDKAAAHAVSRWRFRPAVRAGVPIPAWVQVPVNFRLN